MIGHAHLIKQWCEPTRNISDKLPLVIVLLVALHPPLKLTILGLYIRFEAFKMTKNKITVFSVMVLHNFAKFTNASDDVAVSVI